MGMWCAIHYLTEAAFAKPHKTNTSKSCRLKGVCMAPSVRETQKQQHSQRKLRACETKGEWIQISNDLCPLSTWGNFSARTDHLQADEWRWDLCASVPEGYEELWPAARPCALGGSMSQHTETHPLPTPPAITCRNPWQGLYYTHNFQCWRFYFK